MPGSLLSSLAARRLEADPSLRALVSPPLARYELDPCGYIRDKLGWQPWAGDGEHPCQVEVLDAYTAALRSQLDSPCAPCQNIIRIEAGHTSARRSSRRASSTTSSTA